MYPNAKHIHGYSVKKGNVGIFGAGGTEIGIHGISDKEIFNTLKKGHDKVKDLNKKIMVTHMHPKGSKSEFSGFKGSKAVKKAIDKFKPDIVINSHIHEASGIEEYMGKSKVVNVSKKEKIFEI
jgi:Icc-related predicted phosphoesterase